MVVQTDGGTSGGTTTDGEKGKKGEKRKKRKEKKI